MYPCSLLKEIFNFVPLGAIILHFLILAAIHVSFGLKNWSYEKVLPFFKKIETWSGGENEHRGGSGLLPVNQSKNKNPLFKAFIDSASEAGYEINSDMNGKNQEGFGMFDVTINNGERSSVTKYYLNTAKSRKN